MGEIEAEDQRHKQYYLDVTDHILNGFAKYVLQTVYIDSLSQDSLKDLVSEQIVKTVKENEKEGKTDEFAAIISNYVTESMGIDRFGDIGESREIFLKKYDETTDKAEFLSKIIMAGDIACACKLYVYMSQELRNSINAHFHITDQQKIIYTMRGLGKMRNSNVGHHSAATENADISKTDVKSTLIKVETLLDTFKPYSEKEKTVYKPLQDSVSYCQKTIVAPPCTLSSILDLLNEDLRSQQTVTDNIIDHFGHPSRIDGTYACYDKDKQIFYFTPAEEIQEYVNKLNKNSVGSKALLTKDIAEPNQASESSVFQHSQFVPLNSLLQNVSNRATEGQLSEILNATDVFMADSSFMLNKNRMFFLRDHIAPELKRRKKCLYLTWPTRVELFSLEKDNTSKYQKNAKEAHVQYHFLHNHGSAQYGKVVSAFESAEKDFMQIFTANQNTRFVIFTSDQELVEDICNSQLANVLPVSVNYSNNVVFISNCLDIVKRFAEGKPQEAVNVVSTSAQAESQATTSSAIKPHTEAIPQLSGPNLSMEKATKVSPMSHSSNVIKQEAKAVLQPQKVAVSKTATKVKAEVKPNSNKLLTASQAVEEGAVLYKEDNSTVTLGKILGSGGEGTIFDIGPSLAAKVYHPQMRDDIRYQKIQAMVAAKPGIRELCWPIDLLYAKDHQFVGFTMPKVNGDEYKTLNETVLQLSKESVRKEMMPGWDRLSLVKTCIAILKMFSQMRKYHIIMGDINPNNILVTYHNAIYPEIVAVDTDSMQFAGFPCPVGVKDYTSPEIYKRLKTENPEFSKFLRTDEDEEYALANLLFRILMLNISPYNAKEVGSQDEARKSYNFPYRSENSTGADTPDGPYRMIWNNTLGAIKDNFTKEFTHTGGPVDPETWLDAFNKYKYSIEKGWHTRELLPNMYYDKDKPDENGETEWYKYFNCESCGRPTNMPKTRYKNNEDFHYPQLCPACRTQLLATREADLQTVRCDRCGKPMDADKYLRMLHNYEIQGYGFAKFHPYKCERCKAEKEKQKAKYARRFQSGGVKHD